MKTKEELIDWLRDVAENLGITEIVSTCNAILKDEEKMADWLRGNLLQLVTSGLGAGPGQSAEAEKPRQDTTQYLPSTGRGQPS